MLSKSDTSQIRTVLKEEIEAQIKPVNGRLDKVEVSLDKVGKRLKRVERLCSRHLRFSNA